MSPSFPENLTITSDNAGQRLDQFLVARLNVSRARVQQLIEQAKILVNDGPTKAALKLRGGERVIVLGELERPPLRAFAEEIPLDIVYEDSDLAIINKPAGMMVHAGAGAISPDGEDQRNRGTLVNALLHHFAGLSTVGGELRPGIVHRLDKETSGLIVVAKSDEAHRKLATQFAERKVKKTYIALVHGSPKRDSGTIALSISRDRVRRIRMTTHGTGGREAISHYRVVRRLDTSFGEFALVEVKIDTGRTHQIRVHMAALGHAVVGDRLYGAPAEMRNSPPLPKTKKNAASGSESISLSRNFLHSAQLSLTHPRTGEKISIDSPLPTELQEFLRALEKPS